MISTDIYPLLNVSAITTLVGTSIHPDTFAKVTSYPALMFALTKEESDPTWDTSGMQTASLEVYCKAQTTIAAETLGDVVRQQLNGFQGLLTDGTFLQYVGIDDASTRYDKDALVYVRWLRFRLLFTFTN